MTNFRSKAVAYGMFSLCLLLSACSNSESDDPQVEGASDAPIAVDQPAEQIGVPVAPEEPTDTAENVVDEIPDDGGPAIPAPVVEDGTGGGAIDTPAPVVEEVPADGVTETPAPVVEDTPPGGATETPAPVVEDVPPGEATETPAPVNEDVPPVEPVVTPEPPMTEPVDTDPTVDQPAQPEPDITDNLTPVSATGADTINGPQDDSPTQTESLSIAGPFIRDPARGAGPPSAPTGLTALMAAENWVEFTWAPSTDDQSVETYEVFRDGTLIGTVRHNSDYEHDIRSWISTSFIDCNYTRYANCVNENLQPANGASYAYTVVAIDNEGMRSNPSQAVVLSMATPSQSTVDLSQYNPVFADEFNGTALDRSKWKTSLPWGPDRIINGERQYFVNTFGAANPVDYDPFVFTGETLQITGINTPANQLEAAQGQPYLSGVLSTSDFFEMTYGYVEMRARLASGDGMLSTFYLFNQGFYKNRPEIDVIEYLGSRPDKAYQTYHYYDSNRARTNSGSGEKHSSPTMETTASVDLSSNFHTYAVLWEPGLVVWYIDGREVRRLQGVRVSDEPMNIVTQLVMGSEWAGNPDPAKVPAMVEIDYIRAWQEK